MNGGGINGGAASPDGLEPGWTMHVPMQAALELLPNSIGGPCPGDGTATRRVRGKASIQTR